MGSARSLNYREVTFLFGTRRRRIPYRQRAQNPSPRFQTMFPSDIAYVKLLAANCPPQALHVTTVVGPPGALPSPS